MNEKDIKTILGYSIENGITIDGHIKKTLIERKSELIFSLVGSSTEVSPSFGDGMLTVNQHQHLFSILEKILQGPHFSYVCMVHDCAWAEVQIRDSHIAPSAEEIENIIDHLLCTTIAEQSGVAVAGFVSSDLSQCLEFQRHILVQYSGTEQAHTNLLKAIKSFPV